ncbi:2088_t:CDS:10 [Diversispora eburnea]|uniref:2088_t:CDS:1 n=1 Tax=Diversispora eburnea TaxID=1213867 RepID=A0A9N8VZI3_9GLOM|nr:2088_t:CDS:10 [Diversispora eburnea]
MHVSQTSRNIFSFNNRERLYTDFTSEIVGSSSHSDTTVSIPLISQRWKTEKIPPALLMTGVTFDECIIQTDKHNVKGFWEWENNTVYVTEFPSSFHEDSVSSIMTEFSDVFSCVKNTHARIKFSGATRSKTPTPGVGKEPNGTVRPLRKPQVPSNGYDGKVWCCLCPRRVASQEQSRKLLVLPNRAHDVIAIKLNYTPDNVVPTKVTAWHYCKQPNRYPRNALDSLRELNSKPVAEIDGLRKKMKIIKEQSLQDKSMECHQTVTNSQSALSTKDVLQAPEPKNRESKSLADKEQEDITTSGSIPSSTPSVHETDELKNLRYFWWKTGEMHFKAKWGKQRKSFLFASTISYFIARIVNISCRLLSKLPYELASDISYDVYVEQTDKHNIHGWWDWENGTVRVVELPSGFHESGVGAIVRQINRATDGVMGTNADILATRSHGFAKEADASFRPNQKPHAGGSDGGKRPWPNIVVKVAHSQSVADLLSKVENYWLQPGRAHDAIAIKIEPTTPLSVMTAWHYCINNRTNIGALSPLIYEFGITDRQGNQINLQPWQRVISIQIGCLYYGMSSTFEIPLHLLPNTITIDLYNVQLPYEFATDISYYTYVEQTDKDNIHDCHECLASSDFSVTNYLWLKAIKSHGSGKASFRPTRKPPVDLMEGIDLQTSRVHDAIVIKIEKSIAPVTILPMIIREFGTANHKSNPIHSLDCLYHGMPQNFVISPPPYYVQFASRLCIDTKFFVLIAENDYLLINLDTGKIERDSQDVYKASKDARFYDIYGVLGFLELLSAIHLIVITERKNLGKVQGKDVYAIKRVAVIPLDFERAVKILERHVHKEEDKYDQEDLNFRIENNIEEHTQYASSSVTEDTIKVTDSSEMSSLSLSPSPTIVITPISPSSPQKQIDLEDFEWESVTPINNDFNDDVLEQQQKERNSSSDVLSAIGNLFLKDYNTTNSPGTVNIKDPIDNKVMDARISRELAAIFRSDAFFFSYELGFWWNEHMLQNFIELELHAWILPVMQGFVQIKPCEIDENSFDFIIISRRSKERAGLRYQRRGINEHGNVSNFVETEQIISVKDHEISFLQIRGSIPLFWSQSSYGLKPRPVLERSESENKLAFSKHFDSLIKVYGNVICINLVEACGREAVVGGMKYENISKLVEMLEKSFNDIGYFWKAKNNETGEDEVHCYQKGIFRTNCMDCLDRTNVVQSSLARTVMNLQLLRLGISEFVDGGISHYEQFENIFNDDSISREYAGTSALKGDFTRNLQGVFNDATNSIARLFQNNFKDFFRQRKFEASQPGDAYRWAKVRATAIDISSSIVILENEERINGWTFLSPVEPNTLENSIKKTSQQTVNEVVTEIVKACGQIGNVIEEVERPIISLEEAIKGAGIMAKVGFRFKQALWL